MSKIIDRFAPPLRNFAGENNYRSQFDRVIAQSSFAELVRMMKEKQPPSSEKKDE